VLLGVALRPVPLASGAHLAEKILSAMRQKFGGHIERAAGG